MVKRKGSDYAQALQTAVVSSREATNESIDFSLNYTSDSVAWGESLRIMSNLLEHYDSESTKSDITKLQQSCSAISKIETSEKNIIEKSIQIKESIQDLINKSTSCYQNEFDELKQHENHIETLQKEIDGMKKQNKTLDAEKETSVQMTEKYRAEASQEIEKIDNIETDRMKEVPRLKHQISLYATTTGIKWDFTRVNHHAGEVSIPSLGLHRRFEINPEDYSQFEIANMLWSYVTHKCTT